MDSLPEPPTASIEVGVAAQTVTFDLASAVAAVATDVVVSGVDVTPTPSVEKRERAPCAPQPLGFGPKPTEDTPSAFLAFEEFAAKASAAPTPAGYSVAFTNLKASNNAYGYLGFETYKEYDTNACAAKCTAKTGCVAFNIYFERDPTVDPAAACPDPSSTTAIKCVLWGGKKQSRTIEPQAMLTRLFRSCLNRECQKHRPNSYFFQGRDCRL